MKLKISDTLALPSDATTQKIAFLGRTGSGKTYACGRMVEQMLEANIQVIILDPVGVWYGLRMLADGSPGYPIPVFGGLKGDIPLEPTGGALVADLVVDRGISIVIDVSQFESDAQKARFAKDFADRFFFRKKAAPSAVHLVVEECQEFIPQNPQRDEAFMLHSFVRIIKLGRNFGIGASLVSQRPQEVSKKALNQTELLFAFQMTGPQERKAIELWMSEKGVDTEVAGDLPSLKVGQCFAWSPQWLGISEKIAILPKQTINSSSTPGSGTKVEKRELAPIDLEKLAEKMKDTIERAKADDPKLLRQEILKLRNELSRQPKVTTAPPVRVEIPVFTDDEKQAMAACSAAFSRMESALSGITGDYRTLNKQLGDLMILADHRTKAVKMPPPKLDYPHDNIPHLIPKKRQTPSLQIQGLPSLSGGQRKILTVLAQYPDGKRTVALAHLAGFTVNGHFNNMMGSLRTAEFVSPANQQPITITDAGTEALGNFDPLPSGEALRLQWLGKVGNSAARILRVLFNCYPDTISTADLAAAAGYTVNGHFNNMMGHLRSIELATGYGQVKASDSLFE